MDAFTSNPVAGLASSELLSFVGAGAVALAMIAVAQHVVVGRIRGPGAAGEGAAPSRGTVAALVGIAVMGIGFGMGPRFAPYRAAFAVLPGFNQARVPARWALAMMFAVTVLAALGSSELATFSPPWRAAAGSKGPSGRDRRWLAPLIVGLAALAVGVVPAFDVPFRLALQWAVVFLAVALAANGRVPVPALWRGGLTCGLIAAELVWPALHSPSRSNSLDHSYPAAERPVTRFLEGEPGRLLSLTANPPGNLDYLQATLYPNANATYGLRSIDGYDAGVQITRRWADTLGVLAGVALTTVDPARDQLRPPLDAHRLGRLGVRWVLLDRDVRDAAVWLPGWRGPAFVDGTVEVWENPSYRGEARVVTTWSPDGPLLPTDDDRARIEGVAAGWSISTAAPGAAVPAANSVEVKRTRPEVIDIGLAETSPAGYLVVEEQFDPGWRAEFDGQPVPIIAADGMFMGIAVAPGNHRVVLRYRAPRLRLGLALAVVGAAAVGGLLLWDPLRRRSASVQAGRATQNND